ncbi:ketoacyl-ACP synthase III [Plantactinospora sp. S1510]|uniref:Beta-ketoacyl-[acyl-carrier-protein] synthase III n=1 Tax=Plantactinospora alkalitolerans TaxID=2789879 RepID=A0ABS0H157_9ACTN|nr:beta-ketoacyl-ACP synthase III [Plantactinospora alkalitolerans]MBF9132193.1 ketoacyl-ACP synthase III [Plantactinospora alkalitolerans]
MQFTTQRGGRASRTAVLAGIGGWVPPGRLTNADLERRLGVSDEWITSRTGITARHVNDADAATSDLAVSAGSRALDMAGHPAVDVVVLATTTPDFPCPATAPSVAARLGLPNVPAFDVNAVCSGFVYGLSVSTSMIVSGLAESVLLIAADTFTTLVNPQDQVVAPLFGDGAGAVVLRAGSFGDDGQVLAFDLGSNGNQADLIIKSAGGSRHPLPLDGDRDYLRMDGRAVFRHAVRRMTASSSDILRTVGWDSAELDLLVGHQANLRILRAVATNLGLPENRCYVNLDRVGNTAAASIPLALADAMQAGLLAPGKKVLLTSFGAGSTWASAALTWPKLDHLRP